MKNRVLDSLGSFLIILVLVIVLLSLKYYSMVRAEEMYTYYFPVVSSDGPGKSGVAFSSHADGQERIDLLGSSVSYWRGWQVGGVLPENKWGLESVPSLWCDYYYRFGITNGVIPQMQVIDLLGSEYSGYLLFLNEPDLSFYDRHGQCEVTPYRAAQLYAHTRAALPYVKLVGPGLSHVDYQHGWMWLDQWWNDVILLTGSPPEMYAWDVHNYISVGDPLDPYNSLEDWLSKKGVNNPKFWVSEWGSCSPERTRIMKQAFDNDSRIERHYWYDQYLAYWDGPNRCLTLFNESSPVSLNTIGEAFVGTPYP